MKLEISEQYFYFLLDQGCRAAPIKMDREGDKIIFEGKLLTPEGEEITTNKFMFHGKVRGVNLYD